MKIFRYALVLGVIAVLINGCGGESGSETKHRTEPPKDLQPLHLTLDGEAGPETAGLLTAYKLDYFDAVGIDLTITTPLAPSRPVLYVVDRTVELGISHEPQVALARKKGAPIVAIGSLISEPTLAMIWPKKSGIEEIADLEGKTVAFPGVPFQKRFLEDVLAGAGLTLSDIKLKPAGYDLVPELINHHVDAIFGGSWNVEGAELEARGFEPVVTRASELGLPDYKELMVIARADRVTKHPEVFRRFMAAVRRGTAAAIEDPRIAREAIYDVSFGTVGRKGAEAGLEATLPLLSGENPEG